MSDWPQVATTDEEKIREWFTQWPHANISIVTGAESGIIVIDVDAKPDKEGKNGFDSMKELCDRHGGLPPTVQFATGSGGFHIVFKHPDRPVKNQVRLAPGLDVRGDGGQIIAPPSWNDKGQYICNPEIEPDSTLPDAPLAEMPPWLLALLSSAEERHQDPGERVRFDLVEALQGTAEGGRDWLIFRMACKMRDMDVPEEMAVDWCKRAAQNCAPPFPEKVTEEKVRQAYQRYAPRVQWDSKIFDRRGDRVLLPGERHQAWVRPYPLINPTSASLPENTLPSWLHDYVYAAAESIQVPVEMVAMFALAAIAATVAQKGVVRVHATWVEPLNLYTVVAVPPSGRKSPTFSVVNRPLIDYEREQQELSMDQYTEDLFKKKGFEARIGQLTKNFQKDEVQKDPNRANQIALEAASLQRQLVALEHISLPRLITDDTTPEKLTSLLFQNNERIMIASADGAGVFQQMGGGRYSGGSDVDIYIKGWSGDHKVVDRQTRATERLNRPALTVSLAVQPAILRGAARIVAAKQGLFARFLYCLPTSNIGRRKTNSKPIPFGVSETYYKNMRKLLDLPLPVERTDVNGRKTTEMNVLCFNDVDKHDALQHMLEFETRLEKERGAADDDHIQEWLGKLGGNVARVIGLLHLAENIGVLDGVDTREVWKMPINARTAEAGTRLGEYFAKHAAVAFDEMEEDPIKNDAILIFTWLRIRKLVEFHKSEAIHNLGRAGEKVNAALTFLTERGYIRPKDPKDTLRADTLYEVNPHIHTNDYRSSEEDDTDADTPETP